MEWPSGVAGVDDQVTTGPLVVVGDTVIIGELACGMSRLDSQTQVPTAGRSTRTRRLAGAGLAANLAAREARGTRTKVVLVTALGADPAGELAGELLSPSVDLVAAARTTTVEQTRVRLGDRGTWVNLGGPLREPVAVTAAMRAAVERAGLVLVCDLGFGLAATPELRSLLHAAAARCPVVWDPCAYDRPPVATTSLVIPEFAEATLLAGLSDQDVARSAVLPAAARSARELVRRWDVGSVAVTLGEWGALFDAGEGNPRLLAAPPTRHTERPGLGEQFAASAALAMSRGARPVEAVELAVTATARYAMVGAGGDVDVTADAAGPADVVDPTEIADAVQSAAAREAAVLSDQ